MKPVNLSDPTRFISFIINNDNDNDNKTNKIKYLLRGGNYNPRTKAPLWKVKSEDPGKWIKMGEVNASRIPSYPA